MRAPHFRTGGYFKRTTKRVVAASSILTVAAVATAAITIPSILTNAATSGVTRSSLSDISTATLQITSGAMNLSSSTVSFAGQCASAMSVRQERTYAPADINTLIANRNNNEATFGVWGNSTTGYGANYVTFDAGLSAGGSRTFSGNCFTVRYDNRVIDANGNQYDLLLTFMNVTLNNRHSGRAVTKPYALFNGSSLSSWASLQEATSVDELGYNADANAYGGPIRYVGVSMQVKVQAVQHGTTTAVSGKIPFMWRDIDVPDYGANDSFSGPYAESITIINGVSGNVYLDANTKLVVENSTIGGNQYSLFRGTDFDSQSDLSGLAYLTNGTSHEFIWHGDNAATAIGLVGTKKVVTEKIGSYTNGGTITATDNKILWKETKKVNMSANTNYYIKKVVVDNTTTYSGTSTTKTSHSETISNITSDHVVQVEFAPIPARLIVHYKDLDGNTIATDYSPSGTYYVGDSVDCGLYDPVTVGSKAYRYDHSSKTVTTNGKCTITATTTEVTHFYEAPAKLIVHYKSGSTTIKTDYTVPGNYYVGDSVDCAKNATITYNSKVYRYNNSTPQTPTSAGKCSVTAATTEVTHNYDAPANFTVHYKSGSTTIKTDYTPSSPVYVGDVIDCAKLATITYNSKVYLYNNSTPQTPTSAGKCTVTSANTEVTHNYESPAQLIVHYKDTAGNKIKDDVTTTGTYYVGDIVDCAKLPTIASSSTTPYLYKNSTPQTPDANGKCEVTALKTEVTHVYRIPAKMTIKYKSGDTEIKSPFVYNTDIYVDDELDCKLVSRIQYGTPTVHLYDYDGTDVTILTGNKCKVTSADTVVTHSYNIVNGDIVIHYKDVDTDEEISNPLTVTKPVNDKTTIKKKTITDYMFVGGPDGEEKTHTEATQNYNLYYKRLGTIVTHYIDYDTQEPVADDLIEKGRIGKEYKAEPIDVDGYILYESPEVTDLTFTRDPQEVTFTYRKRASITVRYKDKDTDEDITDPVSDDNGWDGMTYTCKELKLKGYKLISSPKEEDCHYSVEGNTVIFYYQKNKPVNPNTGDSNMLPLALAGVALGLVAALGSIKLIKRR